MCHAAMWTATVLVFLFVIVAAAPTTDPPPTTPAPTKSDDSRECKGLYESFAHWQCIAPIVSLLVLLVVTPVVLAFRKYPPLRDIKPIFCIFQHLGGVGMLTTFVWSWGERQPCAVVLSFVEAGSYILFSVSCVARHYVLYARFRSVAVPLPLVVVFALGSFPYLVVATVRESDLEHKPLHMAYGCVMLVMVAFTRFRMFLDYHPSVHFTSAARAELLCMVVFAAVLIARQFYAEVTGEIAYICVASIAVNAIYLLYVLHPLVMKLGKRDEYAVTVYAGNETANSPTENVLPINDNSSWWFGKAVSKLINTPTPQSSSTTLANTHSATTHRQTSPELRAFLDLIHEGDLRRVQQYVNSVSLSVVSEQDETGRTALHHAVASGDVNVIRFLLEMGADCHCVDDRGYAPIHDAVRRRQRPTLHDRCNIVTELLEGASRASAVNLPTPSGLTALHFALQGDFLGAVNTLLRYDANPLYNHDKEDRRASWHTVHVEQCQSVEATRKSPLMLAVELGYEKHVSSMIHQLRRSPDRTIRNLDVRCPPRVVATARGSAAGAPERREGAAEGGLVQPVGPMRRGRHEPAALRRHGRERRCPRYAAGVNGRS